MTRLSDARREVWLCRPRRNEAAARWVAPISRGGPLWAPGGGGVEAGTSRGQGALCVSGCSLRRSSTSRDSPVAPCLCPARLIHPRRIGRYVPPVGDWEGRIRRVVPFEAPKVRCQRPPGQNGHSKCRANASCAEALQLWVPVVCVSRQLRVPGRAICVLISVF